MKVALDTSAIIYLNDFRSFDEMLTVQEVVYEVRDKVSSMKLSSLNLKIVEPAKKFVDEVKNVAIETGDLEKLSKTDVNIIAVAKEYGYTVVSDDRNVQNVSEKLGIGYISVFSKKIDKLITWKKFCKNCKKVFEKGDVCSVCGSKLVRISEKSGKTAASRKL
jgi:UPF0271 protein